MSCWLRHPRLDGLQLPWQHAVGPLAHLSMQGKANTPHVDTHPCSIGCGRDLYEITGMPMHRQAPDPSSHYPLVLHPRTFRSGLKLLTCLPTPTRALRTFFCLMTCVSLAFLGCLAVLTRPTLTARLSPARETSMERVLAMPATRGGAAAIGMHGAATRHPTNPAASCMAASPCLAAAALPTRVLVGVLVVQVAGLRREQLAVQPLPDEGVVPTHNLPNQRRRHGAEGWA